MGRVRRGLALVKLGGSILTDKREREAFRRSVTRRLARELRDAISSGAAVVIGHGAGSYGHVAAARFGLGAGPLGIDRARGIAHTQERAAALHRLVVHELLDAGVPAYSVAPSSVVGMERGRIRVARLDAVFGALEMGLVPVVYGDVALDRSWGAAVCSTESALLAVARAARRRGLAVRVAIWLGDTPGVWDGEGRTIGRIRRADLPVAAAHAGGSAGVDVTGGMAHRLATAGAFARLGIPSLIADGRVAGNLRRALAGERVPGTRVEP